MNSEHNVIKIQDGIIKLITRNIRDFYFGKSSVPGDFDFKRDFF